MFRKIFWLLVLVAIYTWLAGTGYDAIVLEKGRGLAQSIVKWFDEVEVDFHFKKEKGKKHRRWD
ncbi:MAG: hypothetical protein RL235_888 [Chlamydiota bacterium]|jgi:predicted transcriptional regulator